MVDLKLGDTTIKEVKLVIFDKDGTLMELYHYWGQMIGLRAQLICQRLGLGAEHIDNLMYAMGVDTAKRRLRPEGPVGLLPREVVMQAAVDYLASVGYWETARLCFDVFREVDVTSSKDVQKFIKPIDGMHLLVRRLTERGCRIAVATTDKTERAKLAIGFLGIGNKVSLVVGTDAVSHAKPAPDMVNLILESLSFDRSSAVMVGDAETDVQMGINAGLKASIGVCTGLTPVAELKKITPYVVASIAQISVS